MVIPSRPAKFKSVAQALTYVLLSRCSNGITEVRTSEILGEITDRVTALYKMASPLSVNRRWQELRKDGTIKVQEVERLNSDGTPSADTCWQLMEVSGIKIMNQHHVIGQQLELPIQGAIR